MNESATQQIDEAGKGDQDTSLKPWLCSCPPALHSLTACHSSTSLTLPQGTYTDTFSGLGTGKVEMNQRDQADCKVQVIKFYWVPPSTTRAGRAGPGTPAGHLRSHTMWPGQAGRAARADSAKR